MSKDTRPSKPVENPQAVANEPGIHVETGIFGLVKTVYVTHVTKVAWPLPDVIATENIYVVRNYRTVR